MGSNWSSNESKDFDPRGPGSKSCQSPVDFYNFVTLRPSPKKCGQRVLTYDLRGNRGEGGG